MDDGKLIFSPALLHGGRLDDIATLLMDIELDKAIVLCIFVLDGVELVLVQAVYIANVSQPRVQQAHVFWRHGGFDAAATVVSADDDVFDLEMADRVVDDGHDVEIDVVDEVGDVAMDEHLAGFEACDGFGGDA
jgi:hypothetical protein